MKRLIPGLILLALTGCGGPKTPHDYPIVGKVTDIAADKSKIRIDHEAIPGLMAAMEMTFNVTNPIVVKDVQVGDQVKGTLRVNGGYTIISLDKIAAVAASKTATKAAKIEAALAKLDPKDRELAESQARCPVTGAPLGSMGVPPKLMIKGQPVFVCCDGCNEEATADADKTLAKVAASRKK